MKQFITFLTFLIFITNGIAQFSEEHIITTEAINARYVHSADLNGDNFMDVVVASIGDNTIAWYESLDGLGNFGTKIVITEFLFEYQFVSSADIDGDGDLDILSTALAEDIVVWYENLDGLGNFSGRKNINTNRDLPLTVFAADLDNDGDLDTYSSSKYDGVVAWYENKTGVGDFTEEHIITNQASVTTWAHATDIDNDGDLDMLATVAGDQSIYWYENLDGLGSFGLANLIDNNLTGPQVIIADDLDGDGDMDTLLIEFGGDTISWYENLDGLGSFGVKNIITTTVNAPIHIVTVDLDNDGDQDVVTVFGGDTIAWYENDGLGNFGAQQIITLTAESLISIDVADFDGDGYKDVVSASISDDKVAWYKNLTYLGLEDNALQNIVLTPNPTKGIITIQNIETPIKSVVAYNVLGAMVFSQKNVTNSIDITALQAGLYLLKIETTQGVLVKKIIKE